MAFIRHFFIDGAYLGSAPAAVRWHHEQQCAPTGEAFFCPICTELWATCPVHGQPSSVRHRACSKHAAGTVFGESSLGHLSPYEIPGSILLAEDATFNSSLPPSVLQRELALHLRDAISRYDAGVASAASAIYNSIITSKARQP